MAELVAALTDIAMLACVMGLSAALIPTILLLREYLKQRRREREAWARLCEESIRAQKALNQTSELTLTKVALLKFNVDLLTTRLIAHDPALKTVLEDFKRIHSLEDDDEP